MKRSELLHLLQGVAGFMLQRSRAPLADDQMCFDAGVFEDLQQADAEDGSARAGDSES